MLTVNFYSKSKFAYPRRKLVKLIKSICKRFRVNSATVNILITDNRQIRSFNKKFHHHDSITDCLAFDLSENKSGIKCFELIVNAQKAISEAKKRKHSPHAELALYITHGLLHNFGLDDLTAKKAKVMHRLEDEILQQQGFGRVYKTNIRKNKHAKC